MKDCGRNVWRVVRIILSVICGLFAFVYFILIFFEDPAVVFVMFGLVFAGLSALLVPKKIRIKQVSAWQPDVPQDIARDMRKCYTSMQAENDLRILSDSWLLVQETADIGARIGVHIALDHRLRDLAFGHQPFLDLCRHLRPALGKQVPII